MIRRDRPLDLVPLAERPLVIAIITLHPSCITLQFVEVIKINVPDSEATVSNHLRGRFTLCGLKMEPRLFYKE